MSSGWIVTPKSPSDAHLLDHSTFRSLSDWGSVTSGGFANRLVTSSLESDESADADSDALRASRQRLVYEKVNKSSFSLSLTNSHILSIILSHAHMNAHISFPSPPLQDQKGLLRFNCNDSLDRTNLATFFTALQALSLSHSLSFAFLSRRYSLMNI